MSLVIHQQHPSLSARHVPLAAALKLHLAWMLRLTNVISALLGAQYMQVFVRSVFVTVTCWKH